MGHGMPPSFETAALRPPQDEARLRPSFRANCGEGRLLLEFVVNLPEAQGALGGFHRQLAVILEGDLQR